jgi:hypothetical protein
MEIIIDTNCPKLKKILDLNEAMRVYCPNKEKRVCNFGTQPR